MIKGNKNSKMVEYKINPMIPLAVNLAEGRRRFVLFCGAGVSKDAGVPTGWDILINTLGKIYTQEHKKKKFTKEEIEKWYFSNSKLIKMGYSEILDIVYPGMEQKRLYLNSFFKGKEPGEVHRIIGQMIQQKLIRFIITTNFDNLIEKTLDLIGLHDEYSVISTNDQAKNSDSWDKIDTCRIYKIHGDINQGIIRNSVEELKSLGYDIKKDFQELINRHGVAVLGYSGSDEGVMDCFEKREYHRYPLYWQYCDKVNEKVKNLIKNQDGRLIKNESASEFLKELLERTEMIRESAEVETTDTIIRGYEKLFARDNSVEIKAGIEKERNKYLNLIQKTYDTVNGQDWKSLWDVYLELVEKSSRNILLGEQILRFKKSQYWKEFIKIFGDIHSINKSGDKYGKDGLINYLFYSLFLVIGSRAFRYERFREIRELFSLKRITADRIEYILDWNIQGQFIEAKAQNDSHKWLAPKFQYLLGIIEAEKFPIKNEELKLSLLQFDLLCFMYTVKYPESRCPWSWYPSSSSYFGHRTTPEFLRKIKLDEEYGKNFAQDIFNESPEDFRESFNMFKEKCNESIKTPWNNPFINLVEE